MRITIALGISLLTCATAFGQTPFTLQKRAPAKSVERYGDLPLGAVVRTDERYSQDRLIQGPRGWHYWNRLENARTFQNPNLWGDKNPTYFMGQLRLPVGAQLTMRGKFPHARYFKIALYRFENNTFIALGGEDLAAWDIVPDAGSKNPFERGADRTAEERSYTAHVLMEDAPENPNDRAANTMYAGREDRSIQIVFRIYVPDKGFDGTGLGSSDSPLASGPLVTYDVTLNDGTKVSAEKVVENYGEPIGLAPPPIEIDAWFDLVNSKGNDPELNAVSAPARREAEWFIFRGIEYSVVGAFMAPQSQSEIPLQTEMEGGGDPTTVYMMNYLSRQFGPVYVVRAKMPTFPDSYDGAETTKTGQVHYWSVVTAASAPSGELWDGVFDMQVPLDDDGYYTIVVSRPEDRPSSATHENGVTWIDWGPGEGLNDPRNREDWSMLIMRFMVCDPEWEHSPAKARLPGTEASIMGPYFPTGYYTTAEEFDSQSEPVVSRNEPEKVVVRNTRDMRYGEILLVNKDRIEVFNTTGLNDCPAKLWDAMDVDSVADEHGVLKVQKNGPKFWMMDSQTLTLGRTADFGGIKARWAAALPIKALTSEGSEPYEIFTSKRTQRMEYAAGKPVFELVDPEGHAYVMQAHASMFTLDTLPTLEKRLKKLPEGWQFRTRILREKLVLDLTPDETIYMVGDEFHQYYTRIPEGK